MFSRQRVVKMNKTEDDELEAEALTEEEIKQVAGNANVSNLIFCMKNYCG